MIRGELMKLILKQKGRWMYLYRAIDSEGNTFDFYLSKLRGKQAAKCFFVFF